MTKTGQRRKEQPFGEGVEKSLERDLNDRKMGWVFR